VLGLLRLCRLYYVVPFSLMHLLTVYYARGGEMAGVWGGALRSSGALALLVASSYVMNDVLDVVVDRINAPRRPIPAGRVRPWTAALGCIVLAVAALALGATCRWPFAVVLVGVGCGLVAYNLLSKRLGAAKQLCVAVLVTCIYPLAIAQAGGVTGSRAATLAVFPAWWFLTAFAYELFKDLQDAEGDLRVASRPSPVHRRPTLWRWVGVAALWSGALLLIGPALFGCGWVYAAFASVAMCAALVAGFVPVRQTIRLVFVECLLVGVAATADVMVLGF